MLVFLVYTINYCQSQFSPEADKCRRLFHDFKVTALRPAQCDSCFVLWYKDPVIGRVLELNNTEL